MSDDTPIDPEEFRRRYGTWAIVLGASEGTGATFARRAAELGLNVAMVARRPEPLEELADDIRNSTGVEVRTSSVDLAAEGAAEAIGQLTEGLEVGLVIHNAGSEPKRGYILDRPLEDSLRMVRLNALTPLEVVYKFARPMVERRRGGILLVGSLACAAGNAHMSLYGASKSFMNRLTESLWVQLAESNVDVLCYVAGLTLTTGLLRHKEENDAKGLQTSNFDMASAATPEQVIEESFQSLLNRRGPLRGPGAVPHYDWEAHRWVAGTDEETRQRADVVWDFNKEFVGRYGLPPLTDPRPAGA